MSEIEYNGLVFKVSERLEALNVRDQLLFMCRGKVAPGSEDNVQNVLSLFKELEESNSLGIDRLEVMKDLLRHFEEWNLLEKVEKVESARKEYIALSDQIICALDEVNDLERLIAVCRGKIPEGIEGNVRDMRTLFKELENYNCLGIDCLGILKAILIELEKEDLLKKVEEFENRRCEEKKSQKRNARAAAVVSSVRTTGERMIGAVSVHCTFRNISGALLLVGTGLVLRRCSSLEEFVEAFRVATLPAANALRAISEGSVCFTVQAEHRSALEELWQRYRDGTLQKDLQKFLVTDEIKQLVDGGEVMVTVYIDGKEFKNSLLELKNAEQQGHVNLELEQPRYLDQEKFAFVRSYLEKAEDARSMTTETSDSGMLGTQGALSELGAEETNDTTSQIFLKDLNRAMITELSWRLEEDPVALERFCLAFGLDPDQMYPKGLESIGELFPDTPVKLLKHIFKALQLHDLEDLFEKGKLCALRPALPLKELEKLTNINNRPTVIYSRAEVLIIYDSESTVDDTKENIGSFFRLFDSRTEVTTVKVNSDLFVDLSRIQDEMEREEHALGRTRHWIFVERSRDEKQQKEQGTKKGKFLLEIKQKEEEIQKEMEQFEVAVSAVVNKWTRIEDMESTLFIVYEDRMKFSRQVVWLRSKTTYHQRAPYERVLDPTQRIHDVLCKTLSGIPDNTKVLLARSGWRKTNAIPQTLVVERRARDDTAFVTTMLEILHKRWATLDLIAIMQEVQRTLPFKKISQPQLVERWPPRNDQVIIHDSLTCLPRLKKADENES